MDIQNGKKAFSAFHGTQILLPSLVLGFAVKLSRFTNSGVKPAVANMPSVLE